MGFNSAFKGLKVVLKKPGNGRLNNLNDPVLNVLKFNNCIPLELFGCRRTRVKITALS